jgi:hypothetical protein
MQGIYSYTPITNHVCRVYNATVILWFTLCGTCNVISHAEYFVILHYYCYYYYCYYLSPLCKVFIITYVKHTMFLGYEVVTLRTAPVDDYDYDDDEL